MTRKRSAVTRREDSPAPKQKRQPPSSSADIARDETTFNSEMISRVFALNGGNVVMQGIEGQIIRTLCSQTPTSTPFFQNTGTPIQIEEVVKVPSCSDKASVEIKLAHYDINDSVTVKCSRYRCVDIQNVNEEIHRNVGPGSRVVKFSGLHHNTKYAVQVIVNRRGHEQLVSEQRFRTMKRVNCNWNIWDPNDCHRSMALSDVGMEVCHKNHADDMIGSLQDTHGQWGDFRGICVLRPLNTGLHYWEMVLRYTIEKQLSPDDIIINVGLCNRNDENFEKGPSLFEDCSYVQFYKKTKSVSIGIKFLDGKDKEEKRDKSFPIKIGEEMKVNLGFFLDLYKDELKIILVKSNEVIHTFESHDEKRSFPMCEFQNVKKVKASITLKTDSFESLPTVLRVTEKISGH